MVMEAGGVMTDYYFDRLHAMVDALCDMMNTEMAENIMFELELGDVEEPCLN